ncbi:MAG: GAF domain-containing protein [Anaerolineae bacterium]|nr:GAF domain-containing protein [Anaerolineae bacterium]
MNKKDFEKTHVELLHDIEELRRELAKQKTSRIQYERLAAAYAREQRQRQLSDALRMLSQIVSSTLELEKVLKVILTQLEPVVAYHRALVLLLAEGKLTMVAGRDTDAYAIEPFTIPATHYLLNAIVLDTKLPILVPDVTQEDRWETSNAMADIQSFINAPLLVQGQPIGLLAVGKRSGKAYTSEDTEAVFSFATQVAIAVRNAQLYTEIHEHTQRLTLLHEVSTALNSSLNLTDILTAGCKELVKHFPNCDHSAILRYEAHEVLGKVVAEYPTRGAVGMCIQLKGSGYSDYVTQNYKPLAIYDAQHDPRTELAWKGLRVAGIRSSLVVPLLVKGHFIGTVSLDTLNDMHTFETTEIELAQTVATQIATAIENAELYATVQQDLAERKRAEDQLKQYAAELEKSNAELDAFAHTVAHDLKTPLTALVGYSELLERRFMQMPSEKVHANLHTIARNSRRMTNIINELLLFASVRTMEDIKTGPLDMTDIVTEAQERLADMIREAHAEVVHPPAWPTATGYGPWIVEVWVNYISNAIKYGGQPEAGIAPRIELGSSNSNCELPIPDTSQSDSPADIAMLKSKIQHPEQITFWVWDNGIGLTPKEQARLFSPFTRLDQTRAKGHGLGLSIVQRIIEKLGGNVGVECIEGKGCCFYFTLPYNA